jgi:hypothetical protein
MFVGRGEEQRFNHSHMEDLRRRRRWWWWRRRM